MCMIDVYSNCDLIEHRSLWRFDYVHSHLTDWKMSLQHFDNLSRPHVHERADRI